MVPSLVISGVFPFVLYQVLTGRGVATVAALVAGSVFPPADTLWGWIRSRRLDFIAGISLFFIVISAAASLISGSARFTLIKESFSTGAGDSARWLETFVAWIHAHPAVKAQLYFDYDIRVSGGEDFQLSSSPRASERCRQLLSSEPGWLSSVVAG
jgi:intracellular septation protein A